jgi:ubiquitin fusion degradation protein 1
VLEFTAKEGFVYMPQWMMQNLLLEEGGLVKLRLAQLPPGTFMKLQPHLKGFLNISNPKAMMERQLRGFTCLTVGGTIVLPYDKKKYHIDDLEAKPMDAICVIEIYCEVDFALPLRLQRA